MGLLLSRMRVIRSTVWTRHDTLGKSIMWHSDGVEHRDQVALAGSLLVDRRHDGVYIYDL